MANLIEGSKRLSASRMGFIFLATALSAVLSLVSAPEIMAHSPIFPEENHDPSHAYLISDPAKSWAIYTALDHPDKGDYYKFVVAKGDKIDIALMASQSPSVSGFLPSFALLVPGSKETAKLPSYVEVPPGYGIIAIDGKDPGKASYEPFSPGWLYELAGLTTSATADGTYYIVVYDNENKTGNYGLPVGYVESFTPVEWVTIPYSVHTTYVWEGQNLFVTYLPLILTIAFGGVLLFSRSKKGKAPKGISKWLAAFGGLTFLGTTLGIIYQSILALTVTGFTTEVVFTLIFVVIGILLTIFTLLYAAREKPALTIGWRVGLLVIGAVAVVGWSGFYMGPALAVLAGVMPSISTMKK